MAKKKNPAPAKNNSAKAGLPVEKEKLIRAHDQADKDIGQDPDLTSKTNPGDELDEGELARLEGED